MQFIGILGPPSLNSPTGMRLAERDLRALVHPGDCILFVPAEIGVGWFTPMICLRLNWICLPCTSASEVVALADVLLDLHPPPRSA